MRNLDRWRVILTRLDRLYGLFSRPYPMLNSKPLARILGLGLGLPDLCHDALRRNGCIPLSTQETVIEPWIAAEGGEGTSG